jgi:hypothetical protein
MPAVSAPTPVQHGNEGGRRESMLQGLQQSAGRASYGDREDLGPVPPTTCSIQTRSGPFRH